MGYGAVEARLLVERALILHLFVGYGDVTDSVILQGGCRVQICMGIFHLSGYRI